MPDINKINGLILCDETNVNGVIISNISQIDGLVKNCAVCNVIQLGESTRSCDSACADTCTDHWIDRSIAITPLGVGDYIYRNSSCVCENVFGYFWYSDRCGTRSGSCYTIDEATCQIINVDNCE